MPRYEIVRVGTVFVVQPDSSATCKALASQRLNETFAYGEGQARKLGIKPEEVDGIVREEREKSKLVR